MRPSATELVDFYATRTMQFTDRGIWLPIPVDVIVGTFRHPLFGTDAIVLDAGMGDGRVVAVAAAMGMNAYGIEIDPALARQTSASLASLNDKGLPSGWCVSEGDFLDLGSYEKLGVEPGEIDVFINYPDGNEQALADFVGRHARRGARLALVTADLSLTVSGLLLEEETSVERRGNAPSFRLVFYRVQ